MRRLVLAVVTTVLVVAFGFANAHEVELGYVVGEPAEVRLVFLLATAFAAGVLTAVFRSMAVQARRRRKRARRAPVTKRPVARLPEDLRLFED